MWSYDIISYKYKRKKWSPWVSAGSEGILAPICCLQNLMLLGP